MKRKSSVDLFSTKLKMIKQEQSILDIIRNNDLYLLSVLHPYCSGNCELPEYSINIAAQFNNLNLAKWLYTNCERQEKHDIAFQYAHYHRNYEFLRWLHT